MLADTKKLLIFAPALRNKHCFFEIQKWGISSVGSEHLPYKQGVTGSNPVGPTSSRKSMSKDMDFFVSGDR